MIINNLQAAYLLTGQKSRGAEQAMMFDDPNRDFDHVSFISDEYLLSITGWVWFNLTGMQSRGG